MDYNSAKEMRDYVLIAIENLSRALYIAKDNCSDIEFQSIKRAVGLSIGKLDTEILELINKSHPDLDNLKK